MTNANVLPNPSQPTRPRLFCDTVARPLCGGWALFNRQAGGYAERCEAFTSLDEIPKADAVRLGEAGEDRHGRFVRGHCEARS